MILAHNDSTFSLFGQMRKRPQTDYFKFTFTLMTTQGDSLTTRFYGGPPGAHEFLSGALKLARGGYVLYGSTGSFGSIGNDNFWVVRISQAGDSLWSIAYGGATNEFARSACFLPDSTILIVGDHSQASTLDPVFLHIDTSGNIIRGGTIITPFLNDQVFDVAPISSDRFVVCGEADAGSRVYCVDTVGIVHWTESLNHNQVNTCAAVEVAPDGSIVVAGSGGRPSNANDIYLWKLSVDGDSLWHTWIGTAYDEVADDLLMYPNGMCVVVGSTTGGCQDSWDNWLVAFESEEQTTGIQVIEPFNGASTFVFSTDTIHWTGVGFDGGVSIELNRHYPIGAWETITDSTENDGAYEWFVTDPLSDSCRIRICALQDTFCDVSDGNFSIVSSQGYLALVQSAQPNSALTNWNFGAIECPQATSQWFRLKNFGSESIVVFQPLEPATSEFSRTTTCGTFFALAPNQMSTCSVRVVFDPASDGVYADVLRVQTDAVNGVNGFVEFGLSGEQISTPAAPEVVITTLGLDAHLSWSVVDTSVGGCAVSDLWYAVFYSPTSGGPFYYHGWTPNTTYTHVGVVNFSATQFYQVVAVEGPVAVAGGLVKGMEMGEVLDALRHAPLPPR